MEFHASHFAKRFSWRLILVFVGQFFVAITVCYLLTILPVSAQGLLPQDDPQKKSDKEKPSTPDHPVTVRPTVSDEEIQERIVKLLQATQKYEDTNVTVKNGIVFLEGRAKSERLKDWAAETAGKVEDVVAVFNAIEIDQPSPWDFQPAWQSLELIWFDVIRSLPFVAFGILILLLAWLLAGLSTRTLHWLLRRNLTNHLLRHVFARAIGFLVFLAGLYLVLQVAGLTRLAVTVLGGTGLIGLVLGIAFRDITENFLASIFLSLQQPFRPEDLVDIDGVQGFVQSLTYRVTILMTIDGNHVQIPNATVYKSIIRNFTSNPNTRGDFLVGIDYETTVTEAQEIASKVLADHPAVLRDPEPLVLVEDLGTSAVNLRIYFWINTQTHSIGKVKSSLIRLVKRAFQDKDIAIPDSAREVIFPDGIPVQLLRSDDSLQEYEPPPRRHIPSHEPNTVATGAEGGLVSEANEINEQAKHSKNPEGGKNLLVEDKSEN